MKAIIAALIASLAISQAEDFKPIKLETLLHYKKVTITKVEPDGIRIMHESGMAKIPYEKLPPEIQKQFGFDEASAKAHREKAAADAQKNEETFSKEIEKGLSKAANAKDKQSVVDRSKGGITGTVFQVLSDGILLTDVVFATFKKFETEVDYETSEGGPSSLHPDARSRSVTKTRKEMQPIIEATDTGVFFVECDPSGYVDGSAVKEMVYRFGTYSYGNPLGIKKTIPAFTTSEERFLQKYGFSK